MDAVVEQSLGQVERLDVQLAAHRLAGEDELVHAQPVVGDRQVLRDARLSELREEVVGVQNGRFRGLAQPRGPERADVRVRADEHPIVALETAQAPDRFRPVVVEVEERVGPVGRRFAADHLWPRQVRLDPVRHRHRAGARTAAAMGLGERLVQVEVDDVEAHVARTADPHDRVQVRAVVVQRRPHAMHDPLDLLDPRLEQPERRGIGQHQAGDVLVGLRPQVVEVDVAAGVGADLDHLVSSHRHRRRVRAVGGVGRQHLGPVLAAVLVERSGQQHAGKLALRPRARLQRDVWQPGDLAERVL